MRSYVSFPVHLSLSLYFIPFALRRSLLTPPPIPAAISLPRSQPTLSSPIYGLEFSRILDGAVYAVTNTLRFISSGNLRSLFKSFYILFNLNIITKLFYFILSRKLFLLTSVRIRLFFSTSHAFDAFHLR